jgi:hypothetical protein
MKQFILLLAIFFLYDYSYSQDIFQINKYNDEKLFYVSTSDIIRYDYDNPKEEDILIPDNYRFNVPEDQKEYVYLNDILRARLLNKLHLTEEDNMYIYNYLTNKTSSYSIKQLRAIAILNGYTNFSDRDRDWESSDYYIGFEVPKNDKVIRANNYYKSFVSFGKSSPFETGKTYPMLWKKVDNKEFPINLLSAELKKEVHDSAITTTYLFTLSDYKYYVQKYGDENEIVLILKNNKLIHSSNIDTGESTSLAPLNITTYNYDYPYFDLQQWTGKLFKDKPPVYFGFTYNSFGCPAITLMTNKEEDFIIINCDNRH